VTTVASLLTPPPDLQPWQAQLGPLRLGPGTPFDFSVLDGVDELPELRTSDEPRPWAHGTWEGDDWADGRTITWTLEVEAVGEASDAALAALRAVMVPTKTGSPVPLWFNLPPMGGLVRWDVKVRRHRLLKDATWVRREGGTQEAQFFAPDPAGYGPGRSASTGFAELAGGLAFDLFTDGQGSTTGYLEFGEQGSSGRVDLDNPGNAETWPVLEVAGPSPSAGFEIVDVPTGRRLRYVGVVPAGSVLTIDTAAGSVLLDGVADRSGLLTVREWAPVPKQGATSLAFLTLGETTAATLRAVWAPAWW